ncbi:MAG: DNA-directed RNA polymerase subunit beta', partial [Acidimicrobiales bacterium]
MLNRAPTLHRLGIQAFEPVLVEGKAIQIHPLVCTAFNADFDGDQMAVHLPLSAEAQAEARVLMLSANNVLSPAHGRPLVTPTQDMIIGAYYLTESVSEPDAALRVYRDIEEVRRAYESGVITLHQDIQYRDERLLIEPANGAAARYEPTTAGRVFFNATLPAGFRYINARIGKKEMGGIVDDLARFHPKGDVASSLDAIKNLCFEYASRSGLTVSIEDVKTPIEKNAILDAHEKRADKIEQQFRRGIITDGERRQMEVEVWSEATEQVIQKMKEGLEAEEFNPVNMMVGSGARGNMMQVRQIAGMRGLVANPRGDMIPRPIKSNFREGLKMLEYFIATPGARKGLVDTALRTADSGYLTRRLVDVAQELIINEEDPFTRDGPVRGIWLDDIGPDTSSKRTHLETRLFGRVLADDVTLSDGSTMPAGTRVGDDELETLRDDEAVSRVRVLSPLTDDSQLGISGPAYGMSLATGRGIEGGEAVGVIAAQSIGEPGTQLTMRTFHIGGAAARSVEESEVRSRAAGQALYVNLSGAENEDGDTVALTRGGEIAILDHKKRELERH